MPGAPQLHLRPPSIGSTHLSWLWRNADAWLRSGVETLELWRVRLALELATGHEPFRRRSIMSRSGIIW